MLVIGGRGPMMVVAFRFDEAQPTRADLLQCFESLGKGINDAIDSVEFRRSTPAQVIEVLSQDLVALTYVRKVCSNLGGIQVDPSNTHEMQVGRAIPDWAQTPWREHGWLTRLKIRFARLEL